jgi:hypothetical protein
VAFSGKADEEMRREQNLYLLMLIGAASWFVALVLIGAFDLTNNESEWTMWINMIFFGVATLAFIATLIVSLLVVVTGPKTARFTVLKWLLLFVPSVVLVGHLVPLWVPIMFSLVLSLLPVKWLVGLRAKVNSNVAA